MKGVVLAGGFGTRLYPSTISVSKQLLPLYDKPMIYYPLATLIHAGVTDFLIITTEAQQQNFVNLLGDGKYLGLKIQYLSQNSPEGITQGVLLSEDFVGSEDFWFVLGDNFFHGAEFGVALKNNYSETRGAVAFAYQVFNPKDFGIVEFNKFEIAEKIIEKPKNSKSNWAIPGLYKFDCGAFEFAKSIEKSKRGEYEITDLLTKYLQSNLLSVKKISRGNSWFDLGTPESILAASNFVHSQQERQGLFIGSPEEAAFNSKLISIEVIRECNIPVRPYLTQLIQYLENRS